MLENKMETGENALVDQMDTSRQDDDLTRLLEKARAGDRSSFERILRMYEGIVFRTSCRILGNREDAEDASQEVFLRLFRHLATFDPTKELSPWLYSITVNVCRDLLRKRPPALELIGNGAAFHNEGSPPPEPSTDRSHEKRIMALGLKSLPEKERTAIVLRDIEGLPTAEVARILNSSETTVRSQVCRARLKLREFRNRFVAVRRQS
jgi:RNA polymerase sigma-70 factor (ECF subfamily)